VAGVIQASRGARAGGGRPDAEAYDLDPLTDPNGGPERKILGARVETACDRPGLGFDGDRNKNRLWTLCTQASPRLSRNFDVFGWNNTTRTLTGSFP